MELLLYWTCCTGDGRKLGRKMTISGIKDTGRYAQKWCGELGGVIEDS